MKIKALIIENELKNSDITFVHINDSKIENLHIVGRANSIEEGLIKCKTEKPDLIFLDIRTQNESKSNFIKKSNNPNQVIIAIKSNAKDTLKNNEINATIFLTKPLSPSKLKKTIEEAIELIKFQKKSSDKLIIKDIKKESHIVNTNNIIKLISIGKSITEIYTSDKKIICRKSIGKVQEKLDPTLFIRINWGIVINSIYILKIDFKNNKVYLKDNSEEKVSFRRKKDLKSFII